MVIPVWHVLREGERRLAAAGLGSPGADARLLLAHTLEVEPSRLLVLDSIDDHAQQRYADLLAERADGVPLQHLTGETTFRHSRLRVGPGAFVPRPETEVMAGWALERIAELGVRPADQPLIRVVDLCTGSGAIARALWDETPSWHHRLELHALELSDDALAYAALNLAGTEVVLHAADLADAADVLIGPFDLVVANPPYIPLDAYDTVPRDVRDHDPELALFSGDDGLDAIRVLLGVAATLLRPGGWLAYEHAEVQSGDVVALTARSGHFDAVRDHPDLTGRNRFCTARRAARTTAPLAGWAP